MWVCGIVLTHIWVLQMCYRPVNCQNLWGFFIALLTLADDQLIKQIWLAAPSCYKPLPVKPFFLTWLYLTNVVVLPGRSYLPSWTASVVYKIPAQSSIHRERCWSQKSHVNTPRNMEPIWLQEGNLDTLTQVILMLSLISVSIAG